MFSGSVLLVSFVLQVILFTCPKPIHCQQACDIQQQCGQFQFLTAQHMETVYSIESASQHSSAAVARAGATIATVLAPFSSIVRVSSGAK